MSKGAFLTEIMKNNDGWRTQMAFGGHILFAVEINTQKNRSKRNHTIPIAASELI